MARAAERARLGVARRRPNARRGASEGGRSGGAARARGEGRALPSLLRSTRRARARARARRRAEVSPSGGVRPGVSAAVARRAAAPAGPENTRLLRSLPGLDAAARVLLPPGAEEVLALESIATSVLCSERQLPRVHAMACRAARVLGLERTPEVYVRQSPTPNAQACALGGRAPFIVLHTSLLELLDDDELTAVLATNARTSAAARLPVARERDGGGGRGARAGRAVRRRSRTSSRGGCAPPSSRGRRRCSCAEPRVVVSALMKLAGGAPSLAGELSADAFLQQARRYDEATGDAGAMGWWLRSAHTRRLSHPLPVLRAREVDAFASSKQFAALSERVYGAAAGQQEARAADAGAASGPGASA